MHTHTHKNTLDSNSIFVYADNRGQHDLRLWSLPIAWMCVVGPLAHPLRSPVPDPGRTSIPEVGVRLARPNAKCYGYLICGSQRREETDHTELVWHSSLVFICQFCCIRDVAESNSGNSTARLPRLLPPGRPLESSSMPTTAFTQI